MTSIQTRDPSERYTTLVSGGLFTLVIIVPFAGLAASIFK